MLEIEAGTPPRLPHTLSLKVAYLTLALGALGCDGSNDRPAQQAEPDAAVDASIPEPVVEDPKRAPFPAPDWQVRTPEQQGLRKEGLDAALDYAFQAGKNTQGVVIIRRRALVAERYEAGRDANSFAASWSVGKSFTSALVGIAIDRGLIADVDVKMDSYFSDWAGTPKADMRLRDVLQMASGLAWKEMYLASDASQSDIVQMVFAADALEFAASRAFKSAPGTVFNYSSGDTMLVSGVLERATGKSALDFANGELFSKIGMAPVHWWRDLKSHTLTYCCVDTPSREFAKFGLLFLERGQWNGTRVISEAWIDASLRPSPSFPGYGYFWWLIGRTSPGLPADTYAANGVDGQHIYMIPSLELVVVRNGHYQKNAGEPIADPNLFIVYPSFGLGSGQGTVPPDSWDAEEFLKPIVSAVMDP